MIDKMLPTHKFELLWIQKLQDPLRGPLLDPFFIFFNSLDSAWFILLFVAVVMYLFNRKEGIALLLLFILSGAFNVVLKELFHSPRPCQIDPSIGLLCFKSFGFPSGASQTGAIIGGLALAKCQSKWLKVLGVLFGLTLCFSRIYLGVHFFTDVLAGIAVGIGLLFVYLKLFPLVEKNYVKFAFCLSALFLLGGRALLSHLYFTLGVAIGLLFLKEARLPKTWISRISIFLMVLIGAYFFERLPIRFVGIPLAGFWLVFFGSKLIQSIKVPIFHD